MSTPCMVNLNPPSEAEGGGSTIQGGLVPILIIEGGAFNIAHELCTRYNLKDLGIAKLTMATRLDTGSLA